MVDSLSEDGRMMTAESVAASHARDYEAEQKAKEGRGSPLVPGSRAEEWTDEEPSLRAKVCRVAVMGRVRVRGH